MVINRSIRKAAAQDIPAIMDVMTAAKRIMRQSGNMMQWEDGYPSEAVIVSDMEKEGGFVVEEAGKTVGYFAFLPSPEPTYAEIYEGSWIDEARPYHVIHRIASYPDVHGVFSDIIHFCFSKDRNIRIDTHRDNKIMQHNILKHGFIYCGIIYLASGDDRLAYQRAAMTEKEKMLAGMVYDANYDKELQEERRKAKDLCYKFNGLTPSDEDGQQELLRQLLGSMGEHCDIKAPFWCDYGYNIQVGRNFFANHNTVILDGAKVTFGDNVFVAPNCGFYTAGHPINARQRNAGLEYAKPITIGSDVWIGAGVHVMPGVTIGSNVVIGGGSVVVKDIPSNSVAVGNPCKVIRRITEEDKTNYAPEVIIKLI